MRHLLITGLALLVNLSFYSQTYIMTNGSISTCSGDFYDDGGIGNDYAVDTTLTYTVCSSNPGFTMSVIFNSFDTESGYDDLCIYDGNTTGAPLIGCFSGTELNGETIEGTGGCLTFEFYSDFIIADPGWEATFDCQAPCQAVDATVSSVTPTPTGPENSIQICLGDSVQATANVAFPENNTYYAQSAATSTFTWFSGGGFKTDGQSVNITYNSPRRSVLYLIVEDIEGCSDTVKAGIVSAGLPPTFSDLVFTDNDTICLDDSVTITISPQPTELTLPSLDVGDTINLPDGSGQSYTSSLNINIFDPGTTYEPGFIEEFFSSMEHSFLGDLEIKIICPNGQEAILKGYPGGGGTYLGEPVDVTANNGVPGVGYLYGFSQNNNNFGTMVGEAGNYQQNFTDALGNNYTNEDYLPSGSYLPEENYDLLLTGCPLNGPWTIEITDNLGIDDGFVFEWGITFNEIIMTDTSAQTVIPQVIAMAWDPTPTIVDNPNDSTIIVSPADSGKYSYVFKVQDDFGCAHDTTISIYVKDRPQSFAGNDTTTCLMQIQLNPEVKGIDPVWSTISGNGSFEFDDSLIHTPIVKALDTGVYSYALTEDVNGCQSYPDTINVLYYSLINTIDIGVDNDTVCIPNEVTFANLSDMTQFSDITWNLGDGTEIDSEAAPVHGYTSVGCYDIIVTLTSPEGCTVDSIFPSFVCAYNYPTANFTFNPFEPVVPQTQVTFTNLSTGSGNDSLQYIWFFDTLAIDSSENPIYEFPTTFGGTYTNTLITYNEGGCADTVSKDVTVKNFLSIFVPNSFTPNGDNANDFFYPVLTNSDLIEYNVYIFDRWGNIVSESDDMELDYKWNGRLKDGSPAPMGIYSFLIRFKELDDTKNQKMTGHITLFR